MPGHRSKGPKCPAHARPDAEPGSQLVAPPKTTYRIGHGRPTNLTPTIIDTMTDLVTAGLSIKIAVKALGIPQKTAEDWSAYGRRDLARGVDSIYAQWWSSLEEAKASCEANLVKRICEATLYDWKAAAYLLERRHPERWQTPDKIPNRLGDNLDNKSTEELKQMLAEIAEGRMPKFREPRSEEGGSGDGSDEPEEAPAVIDVENTGS